MIVVPQSVELLGFTTFVGTGGPMLDIDDPCSDGARLIERAGRVCWKSEGQAKPGSARGFCERVLQQFGHESIAEHASATMVFVTDRIVSHQLVRHRIAAYSQESTHYLNYSNGRHGSQIRVCKPVELLQSDDQEAIGIWQRNMEASERDYFALIERGVKHYTARYVLPMGLKTEVVATYNFRMWKHVVKQRTEMKSDGKGGMVPKNTPEIHFIMNQAKATLFSICPEVFYEFAPEGGGAA